jgi:hypothetical protein
MAPTRDEENKMYGCMMLPVHLHRVHAPEDDPKAYVERGSWRWRRMFRRRNTRRLESATRDR